MIKKLGSGLTLDIKLTKIKKLQHRIIFKCQN